jgi:hypothetical protein
MAGGFSSSQKKQSNQWLQALEWFCSVWPNLNPTKED